MRDIKFRALVDGKMVILTRVYFHADGDIVASGDWGKFDTSEDPIPVMQYSGLKDKNGTDIYEGDIICWKEVEENYAVTFDAGSFITMFLGVKDDINYNDDQDLHFVSDICEIIGNIHQNPELVK